MSDSNHFKRIPTEYRQFWVPFLKENSRLYHLTTQTNLSGIHTIGFIEPHDPAPKHWAGMRAVFLSDPHDPRYHQNQTRVQKHVHEKGDELVRLIVVTRNTLFACLDPERTSQVISLDPIPVNEIKEHLILQYSLLQNSLPRTSLKITLQLTSLHFSR